MNAPLLDIHGLRHTFPKADGGDFELDAVEHQKLAAVGCGKGVTQTVNVEQGCVHDHSLSKSWINQVGICARRTDRVDATAGD